MARTPISSAGAPAAIGPYSQAIRAGQLLFVSGQIPLDPATGALVAGGVGVQTQRVIESLGAILASAGGTLDDVVKTTVYLADMTEFAAMNEVYAAWFGAPGPARATVEVARLPKDARVEIDAIAWLLA